jgi:DNA repair protein RecN (Recombination protein N)
MLCSLSIRNVVLIDQLEIEFKDGFCALTGETGAGKSILLDSLSLSLGARADSGLVRKGADQASVTAVFEIPKQHPVHDMLKAQDLQSDTTLVLRRTLGTDGRSRAFINDQPVSAGLLKQIGDSLVEIHGQFEAHGLLNPATHLQILDEYAGFENPLQPAWDFWRAETAAFDDLRNQARQSKEDEEYLRTSIHDLDALDPQRGEEESLSGLRARLMHRERVLEALNTAHHTLSDDDDPVRKALAALDKVADKIGDAGAEIIAALDRSVSEIEEARGRMQSLSSELEHADHDLQSIDDRLFDLRAQARKHSCTIDDLPDAREKLATRLNMIEHAGDLLETQQRKMDLARKSYITLAEKIHQARQDAGKKLDTLVQKELPPLKLDKARFATSVERLEEPEWGPHGMSRVRFLVATNPGSDPGPLNKIASGGELSRFMLALKVVMAEIGAAGSLVFDEVDAGISGSTADAVGERLARLARKRQVLVVTHAPQVAARADHHWIVRKDGAREVKTNVLALHDLQARREEIARMLSGASITEEARAAAEKLLETGT